jgi:hypothetical protein
MKRNPYKEGKTLQDRQTFHRWRKINTFYPTYIDFKEKYQDIQGMWNVLDQDNSKQRRVY